MAFVLKCSTWGWVDDCVEFSVSELRISAECLWVFVVWCDGVAEVKLWRFSRLWWWDACASVCCVENEESGVFCKRGIGTMSGFLKTESLHV